MRRGIVLGIVVAVVGSGLVIWLATRDDAGPGRASGAPRFESLEDLAAQLNEHGYGCVDYHPIDLSVPEPSPIDEVRSAAGSCPTGDAPMDLAAFRDADDQREFQELAGRYACVVAGDDIHYVNGNLWIVELVSPDPAERGPDLAGRLAQDLRGEHVTIDC